MGDELQTQTGPALFGGEVSDSDPERPSKRTRTEGEQLAVTAADGQAAPEFAGGSSNPTEASDAVIPQTSTMNVGLAPAPATSAATAVTAAVEISEQAPGAEVVKKAASTEQAAEAAPNSSINPNQSIPATSVGPAPSPHKTCGGDVVYRVLVHASAVGVVIGKAGCNVKEIQSGTGARVQVATAVPTCDEHVVVVSMAEDPQMESHGAEKALVALQRLLVLNTEPAAAAVLDSLLQQDNEQQQQQPQHAASTGADGDSGSETAAARNQQETPSTADAQNLAPEAVEGATAAAASSMAEAGVQLQDASAVSEGAGVAQPGDPPLAHHEQQGTAAVVPADTSQPNRPAGDGSPAPVAPDNSTPPADTTDAAAAAAASPAAEEVVTPGGAKQATAAAVSDVHSGGDVPAAVQVGEARAAAEPSVIPALAHAGPGPPTRAAAAGAAAAPRVQHVARLLLGHSQSLSLLAHGASALKAIKEASGVRLQVHFPEDSPLCALEGDRVAQLGGRAEQVMKGVQLLASHLRKHPAREKPGAMHPALAARIAAAHRPPPPPRRTFAPNAYGVPHPGYGAPGYGY